MEKLVLCLLICASLLVSGVHCSSSKCMSYESLENSLKDDPSNMEKLVQAFFPTDLPTSSVVNVTYFINSSVIVNEDEIATPAVPGQDAPSLHRVLRESQEPIALSNSSQMKFRWTATPITLIIGPELLEVLSLYAFQTTVAQVNLTIEVDPRCTIPTDLDSDSCEDKSDIVALLSELTSNVSLLVTNTKIAFG